MAAQRCDRLPNDTGFYPTPTYELVMYKYFYQSRRQTIKCYFIFLFCADFVAPKCHKSLHLSLQKNYSNILTPFLEKGCAQLF